MWSMVAADGRPATISMIYGDGDVSELAYRPEWECDPCALGDRRYRVADSGRPMQWQEYPWYAVVTPLDSAQEIATKRWAAMEASALFEARGQINDQLKRMGAISLR